MFRSLFAIRILMMLSLGLAAHAEGQRAWPPGGVRVMAPPAGGATTTAQPARSPAAPGPGAGRALPANPAATCNTEASKSPILVLSIDGAAVRGIAQFIILQAFEEQVNLELRKDARSKNIAQGPESLSEKTIPDMFDFFAGTSAGSVNVGGLLIPENYKLSNTYGYQNKPKYTLAQLKNKLPETLKAAFSRSIFRDIRTLQIPGKGGLLGSKFTATPFEDKLKEYAGNARISDLVKPAVLTSYDWREREIMNFSTEEACSLNPGEDVRKFQTEDKEDFYRKDKNVYIWQAIRASSAAPVFYKPLVLEIGGKQRALIDAGLFVMSPTLLGWVEVQKVYPGRRLIFISISSGTLNEAREVEATGATAGSIPKVLQPTIETALEGQQALTDKMMRDIRGIKYHRLSFEVKNKEFDDTSPENIQKLEAAATVTIASVEFKLAVADTVKAILERQEKLKKDPKDFKPFICAAKQQFRENLDIGQINPTRQNLGKILDKTVAEDKAKEKIQAAFEPLKTKGRENCLYLLFKMATKSPEWKNGNCENLLTPKEICTRIAEQSEGSSRTWNKTCYKKVFKPKTCQNLQDQMNWNRMAFSERDCAVLVQGQ